MFILEWKDGAVHRLRPIKEGKSIVKSEAEMVWYDLPADPETFSFLGHEFDLKEYWLRRCEKGEVRSKAEEAGEFLYLSLPWVVHQEDSITINVIHIFVGRTRLVTIHDGDIPEIEDLAAHIPNRVALQGPDILLYLIADSLLDPAFNLLDKISETIDELEDQILTNPASGVMERFFQLKRNLLTLRKGYSPVREVFALLAREEKAVVDPEVLPYMAELYDRIVRLHETIDLHRDLASSATEIYLSTLSNRMNEKMTTLTIVSTIILPLTLITGYYGMNFKYFSELNWHWGLGFLWGLMVVLTSLMVYFFKKRHWF